ncbi:MAG: efflux RND transporter periplasmic adaptor subunit [Bacteroidota bacterium]
MYKTGITILSITVLAAACNFRQSSQQPADLHSHADEASRFTLFSEHIEFFVEHEPLEAGKESEFLVHVTNLNTYKPFATGSVKISIDGVSVTSGQPLQPGIFEVPFIPKKEGTFHAVYTYQSNETSETVEGHVHIYGNHEDLHSEDGPTGGHSHGSEAEGEISFLKEQAWNSRFMVSEIREKTFYSVIPTSGEILAMPGEKKNVAANGKGMVLFASRNLVQGSPVTQGEHLFTISSETMLENNIELQYQEYQNSYEKSRSEYLRHKKLFAEGAISEREFINTRADYQADSLRFYNLKKHTTSEGLKVIAPVTGTIHELNVSEGQFIDVGEIMVIISSNRTLLIRADLGQQHYNQLSTIETANFRPAYSDQVYSLEEMHGKLLARGSSVAENDHYLPVMFEVQNDGRILEGAFTEIYLKTTTRDSCLVLPETALTEEQGEFYAYIQQTGESYSKIAVTTGSHDGKFVEITAGLNPGDRVVTEGVMLLKAASMESSVVGHGHSH